MKFTCQRDIILKEISDAGDFTSQKTSQTILSSVYISLSGDSLTIKTTDQKMGFFSEITVMGNEDGSFAVMCDKLSEILKNLPASEILFEEKEEKLLISPLNSSIEFSLRMMDPSGFPEMDIPPYENFFKIPQKDMTDMINQVSFAVSDDETKFAMNGALFEKDSSGIIMVGTDGRRLSYINRKIATEIPDFGKITIPSRFLSIIKKHSLNEGDFDVCVTSQSLYVKSANCIIFSNLIKNEFPSYRRVIPEKQTYSCIVNIKALEEAIKRVSLLVESKYKKLIIEFSPSKLTLSTEHAEVGSGKEEIPCNYDGETQKSAVNYMYLLNPIRVMEGENVKIEFSENGRPFTVTPEPERDYLHVIMPMNLK